MPRNPGSLIAFFAYSGWYLPRGYSIVPGVSGIWCATTRIHFFSRVLYTQLWKISRFLSGITLVLVGSVISTKPPLKAMRRRDPFAHMHECSSPKIIRSIEGLKETI